MITVQQVNLYQDSLKPKPLNINLYVGVAAIFAFFIGFSVVNAYLIQNLRNDSRLVEQKRQTLESEQARIKLLESTIPKQEINTALSADLELWQKKVTDLNETLATLTHKGSIRSRGFSAYFQALANQPVAGAWLTKIHFDAEPERISLEGNTLRTDKIPDFLQQLQQQPAFQGLTFAQLQIQATEQNPNLMRFTLNTHLDADKKDDAK